MGQIHKTLAAQCGAVLLKAKPAALFSQRTMDYDFETVTGLLAESGMQVREMRCGQGRSLLMVYDPQLLEAALADKIARRALEKLGYPVESGQEEMLLFLQRRMSASEDFPHEIGFFLGYPPADVIGFMIYGGQRFKHSGMWKVYSNVDRAKNLCDKFEACRRFCCRYIEMGGSLESLLGIVNKAG